VTADPREGVVSTAALFAGVLDATLADHQISPEASTTVSLLLGWTAARRSRVAPSDMYPYRASRHVPLQGIPTTRLVLHGLPFLVSGLENRIHSRVGRERLESITIQPSAG
jgi:hypothetical protein